MSTETILYERLIEVACLGKTIGRDEVAGLLGLDLASPAGRQELVRMLDDIACNENAAGRPLLSAVVVLPEIGYPGKAFFLLARELGLNHFGDDRSYYYYELRHVHEYWKQRQPATPAIPFKRPVERSKVLAMR